MGLTDTMRRQRYRWREASTIRERGRLDRESERNQRGLSELEGVQPAFAIPADRGFVRVESLDPAVVAACVSETQERFRSEQGRNQQLNRKPYFIEFTGLTDYDAGSPAFRLATSPSVVRAVADYLGSFPQLHNITSVFSPASKETIAAGQDGWKGSQLFHRDGEDRRLVKIWVLCGDVTDDHGPTMMLPADLSDRIADRLMYPPGVKLTDEPFVEHWGELSAATGPTGTVYATDTSRCFHFGSRTAQESSRLVLMLHYMTEHSSSFENTSARRSAGDGLGVDPEAITPMARRLLGVR
jgi:hypothetical protein